MTLGRWCCDWWGGEHSFDEAIELDVVPLGPGSSPVGRGLVGEQLKIGGSEIDKRVRRVVKIFWKASLYVFDTRSSMERLFL